MGAPRRPHKTGKSKGDRILERRVKQLEKELLAGRSSGGRRKSRKDISPVATTAIGRPEAAAPAAA